MVSLPTNRTISNTPAEHVADHNTIHGVVNNASAMNWEMATSPTYGADPTGVGDSTANLQAAADAAAASGATFYAAGTFRTSSTLTIKGHADLQFATLNYSGSGTAVQIGVGTSGTILLRKTIRLPRIICTGKPGTGWTASTIGVKASNTYACIIWAPHVQGFETGYYAYGTGTGNVYNEVHLLHQDNNKRNLVSGADATGWSNANNYYLGLLTHNSGEGTAVSGVRGILNETATNVVNGNHYFGGSLEGNVPEYHVEDNGQYDIFDGLRWEASGGARVLWGATAVRNEIRGGYSAQSVVETHTAGSNYNRISTSAMSRQVGTTAKAVQWLENTSSSTAFADAVMDPGATVAGSDPATAYRVARSGDFTKMKRASDTYDRIRLDHSNGRIYLGDNTADPTTYLTDDSSNGVWKLVGRGLEPSANNTYDLGINATRWRYARLGTGVVVGSFATGSRPAAGTGGVGTMVYDSTLSKPIWSDGTVWRDATGTAV